jgi:uncharacterized membrane protein
LPEIKGSTAITITSLRAARAEKLAIILCFPADQPGGSMLGVLSMAPPQVFWEGGTVTGSQGVRYFGFVSLLIGVSSGSWAATIYTFTTIDFPPAISSNNSIFPFGINNAGQIVGYYGLPVPFAPTFGFLKDGPTFTTIDPPDTTHATVALGINNAGQIVGSFANATGGHGFLKDGATFTTIDDPRATRSTQAAGINDAGQIVGNFIDAMGSGDTGIHGFLKDGETFTTIDVPGAIYTNAVAINDAGQIVGNFFVANETHGFLKDNATFTMVDGPALRIPGTYFNVGGINNAGQIVGTFSDATGLHGFLQEGTNSATVTTIDHPDALSTEVLGINDAGQIVGRFVDATGIHEFVATPVPQVPEPATWLQFGLGLVGVVWWRRRRAATLIAATNDISSAYR